MSFLLNSGGQLAELHDKSVTGITEDLFKGAKNMGKGIFVSALCLWLLISGCATQPQMRVTGTDSILVGQKLTNEMLKLGYGIQERSDHSIVFEKEITEWTASVWPEGCYDMKPSSRVSYTLHEQNGTVQVVAELEIITKSGRRLERIDGATSYCDSTSIEKVLRQVKQDLENEKKRDSQSAGVNTSLRRLK